MMNKFVVDQRMRATSVGCDVVGVSVGQRQTLQIKSITGLIDCQTAVPRLRVAIQAVHIECRTKSTCKPVESVYDLLFGGRM